ncbi:MAG: hypothetical protein ACM3JB_01315 [Acidobacteriaceae bacterium]
MKTQNALTIDDFHIEAERLESVASMRFLTYLVRGLHNAIGITAPEPQHEAKVVLVWLAVILLFLAGIVGFGYLIIHSLASIR